MLLLLPPSEGKTAPRRGAPLDLSGLVHPALSPVRERTLEALARFCAEDPAAAADALGLGPRGADEVLANVRLRDAPTAAASRVYTGVLYDCLALATLSPGAKRRAARRVLIFSALWGVLRPADRIPAYRLPAGARIPGLPTSAALWRAPLRDALPDDELAVDLRSGPYRALWRPAAAPLVAVDVVRERDGRRSVVSHMAKATRGEVARLLLEADGRPPRSAEGVAERVAAAGRDVELSGPGRDGASTLTVVEPG